MNEPYAVLIGNGHVPESGHVARLAAGACIVVCADGGANTARWIGITPDAVIGDFDSMTDETRFDFESRGVRFVHQPDQEKTDFEKALHFLLEKGMKRVAVLGITGRMLDHTLGNFSILKRHADELDLVVFDTEYRIDIVRAEAEFSSVVGERISIIPLTEASGVTFEGLAYPLTGETLSFGIREGTCNRATAPKFRVSLESGLLLVFRPLTDERWIFRPD
ncbi:MAG: thiamine diphosphokinase [Bacteroidota bacterium]|nr:thiamine diphosphokinase [Bacteroidota bacterium]